MSLRRQPKPEVIATGRGSLAEALAELRRSRPGRTAAVESRLHAAAVEAARLTAAAAIARQQLDAVEREAHGQTVLLDREEHLIEQQLAATCSPEIERFLDVAFAWWEKARHATPEAVGDETQAEAWARHRALVARFHAIRRECLALQYSEVPDLHDRLAAWAYELRLKWVQPPPAA